MSASSVGKDELPRALGFFGAITIVVGITIGSGIFRSPAGIADRLPSPGAVLLVWVVGGIVAMCGALALAEVASSYPKTGAIYVFLREGWGRLLGFLFGWAELAIIRAAAIGAISITFAEYFLRVLAFDPLSALHDTDVRYTAAGAFVAMSVMLSTFGSLNSSILANPRVFIAMAEDGLFFKSMAAVHPKFKTPVNAIVLAAILGVAFVLLRRFWATIAVFSVILIGIPVYYATVGRQAVPLDVARRTAGETA